MILETISFFDGRVKLFSNKAEPEQLFDYFSTINHQFIMGMGNIVGWGENFVSQLKEYKT